jgi:hypothetical protein
MNMAMQHNPYAIFDIEGPQIISNGFGGPRFSWKARLFAIVAIVLITTIGGAFRITIGASGKTPSYTNAQLQRSSGVVLQESYHSSDPVEAWESTSMAVWLNNVRSSERVLLDVEVFDQNNQRIFQRSWDNVLMAKGKPGVCGVNCQGFVVDIPGLMPGTYTVDVGIFKPRWQGGPIRWYDNVETFRVR